MQSGQEVEKSAGIGADGLVAGRMAGRCGNATH